MWRQPAPQQGWGPSRPSAGLCPLSLGAGEAGAALPSLLLGPEPWTVSSAPRDLTRHRGIYSTSSFQCTTEREEGGNRRHTEAGAPVSPRRQRHSCREAGGGLGSSTSFSCLLCYLPPSFRNHMLLPVQAEAPQGKDRQDAWRHAQGEMCGGNRSTPLRRPGSPVLCRQLAGQPGQLRCESV